MIYLKQLNDLRKAEEARLQNLIKTMHPVVKDASVYSYRNISIQSDNFSIDLYDYTPIDKQPQMNCSVNQTAIPTEEEAIEKVRALRSEQTDFLLATAYVRQLLTPPIEL